MNMKDLEKVIMIEGKSKGQKIRALVCGHTGATGKALVKALNDSPYCESIVAIGRREYQEFKEMKKVTQHIVPDMTKLNTVDINIAKGANAAFCCIGTPFTDVFSKKKQDDYHKVDFGIATGFAKFAHDAGVDYYTTITGEGTEKESNSNMHMYRVKQDVEKYVTALQFDRTTFIRPGFLNRGKDAGFVEKLMLPGLFGIEVKKVAESMIWSALTQSKKLDGPSGNKELKRMALEFEKANETAKRRG